jgi:hypothetical protein
MAQRGRKTTAVAPLALCPPHGYTTPGPAVLPRFHHDRTCGSSRVPPRSVLRYRYGSATIGPTVLLRRTCRRLVESALLYVGGGPDIDCLGSPRRNKRPRPATFRNPRRGEDVRPRLCRSSKRRLPSPSCFERNGRPADLGLGQSLDTAIARDCPPAASS